MPSTKANIERANNSRRHTRAAGDYANGNLAAILALQHPCHRLMQRPVPCNVAHVI
jgi:hypothetical protein